MLFLSSSIENRSICIGCLVLWYAYFYNEYSLVVFCVLVYIKNNKDVHWVVLMVVVVLVVVRGKECSLQSSFLWLPVIFLTLDTVWERIEFLVFFTSFSFCFCCCCFWLFNFIEFIPRINRPPTSTPNLHFGNVHHHHWHILQRLIFHEMMDYCYYSTFTIKFDGKKWTN